MYGVIIDGLDTKEEAQELIEKIKKLIDNDSIAKAHILYKIVRKNKS